MTQLNSDITPLETRYAGYRFRSRLEARWAVFFTRLGLDWQYEPQGFMVGRPTQSEPLRFPMDPPLGTAQGSYLRPEDPRHPYLPDFYLPLLNLWVEVKPAYADRIDPEGVRRWEDFAGMVMTEWPDARTAMFLGPIPNPDRVSILGPLSANTPPGHHSWYDDGIVILGDCDYAWCACPSGNHFDIQFEARGGRICCGCPRVQDDDRHHAGNHPKILNAYAAARSARFEHGETA